MMRTAVVANWIPSSCRVKQSITDAKVNQPFRAALYQAQVGVPALIDALGYRGQHRNTGTKPTVHIRACECINWKSPCTVFLFMPNRPANVR